jgi:hypothetical protein
MRYEKFGINGQLQNKLLLIVIHRFSLVKVAMNATRIYKMRNGVSKTPSISFLYDCKLHNEKKTFYPSER